MSQKLYIKSSVACFRLTPNILFIQAGWRDIGNSRTKKGCADIDECFQGLDNCDANVSVIPELFIHNPSIPPPLKETICIWITASRMQTSLLLPTKVLSKNWWDTINCVVFTKVNSYSFAEMRWIKFSGL